MKNFNLSDWALQHRSLVWYFMIVASVAGLFSYFNLGRAEDPNFTIRTMIIQAQWPGATVTETINQVTDRIEKKLEELDSFDYAKSLNMPGKTTIFVQLKESTPAENLPMTWTKIRNMIHDIENDFPDGVIGPFFNDNFGDVFGNIYAFTSDGLSQRQLRDYVEDIRAKILALPNAGKVELIGEQDEVIYLDFSTREMAALGITGQMVIDRLQAQNAISPSGTIEANGERVAVRVSGQFSSEESLREINLLINERFFRLGDVATIYRGYVDPPTSLFQVGGEPAIGLAIGMKMNANLLHFGEALKAKMSEIEAELPIGVKVHLVSDQPAIVEEAVGGFTRALFEAVAIVLIVSFLSLGLRAGFVVALTIPLVLAITFIFMDAMGISLQRISLGALIIALGLLVDDAMIAVEMMVSRLEIGDTLRSAATYVYTSTAFPMLTGTLVTVASFIPVGLNNSSAGDFTYTLFVVIAVSLVVSWLVAVLFAPLLGVTFLPKKMKHTHTEPGRLTRAFNSLLRVCVRRKWLTISITSLMFLLSIGGMQFVQQQFFPISGRPEIIIDWTEAQNASITQTREQMQLFEKIAIEGDPDVEHWSTYIGQGSVRFVLSYNVLAASPNFGQFVIVAKDIESRNRLLEKFKPIIKERFFQSDVYVHTLEIGPPVGRPVQYRVSGADIQTVRSFAQQVAAAVAQNQNLTNIAYDWNEPSRVVKVDVLQDKAAQLGITTEAISTTLNAIEGGLAATKVRDSIYLVNVVARAKDSERSSIDTIRNLQIQTSRGDTVPLAAIANFRYEAEQPAVWRRGRLPTISVKAAVATDIQPATVVQQLAPAINEIIQSLPTGYKIVTAGSVEESGKGQAPIIAIVPIMLLVMATLLMIQLQSFQRLFLVVVVAPLGLIGVVSALVFSGAPLGFVAILGILALIGILIRNSVILVIQIEHLRQEGKDGWTAVIEATEHRMRPIMLTAAAASLALIPIAREIFWGPMAYAMIGGIIVGTVLTLLFLPALYVAWFRFKEPENEPEAEIASG